MDQNGTIDGTCQMKTICHTRYPLIEPLRGIASVWVFLFHYGFCEEFQSAFPLIHKLIKVGNRGVPMFFVISGYCLAAAAQRAAETNESCGRFLQRRVWRIFPTFWISIATIVLLHLFIVNVTLARCGNLDLFLVGRFEHYHWFDWLKIASLTQIFDRNCGKYYERFGYINGAYWSLSIEFQFYLIVAISLFKFHWFIPMTGLLSVISLLTYCHPSLSDPICNTGLCVPFWSWFALGVAVYAAFQRGWTPERAFGTHARSVAFAVIAVVVSIFAVLVFNHIAIELLVFAIGFALLLWIAKPIEVPDSVSLGKAKLPQQIAGRLMIGMGAMSYSLYLMHNQVSDCVRRLLVMSGCFYPIVIDLVCAVATLAICYGFYSLCEAPFLKMSRSAAMSGASLTLTNPIANSPSTSHIASTEKTPTHSFLQALRQPQFRRSNTRTTGQ